MAKKPKPRAWAIRNAAGQYFTGGRGRAGWRADPEIALELSRKRDAEALDTFLGGGRRRNAVVPI